MTALVLFLYVINYADKALLGIIAQPLSEDLGLDHTQIGLVGSVFYATFTVGGFLAGPLAKYMTLRWALVVLSLAWSAVMLPFVITAGFVALLVGRMLLGLAEGPAMALMYTATFSWHPPAKRGLPSALLIGSASIAKIALAPVLTFLAIEYDWRSAFIALFALGMVWVLCWLLAWQEGPFTAVAVKNDSAGTATDDMRTEPDVPWSRILCSRTYVTSAILVAVLSALTTVVLTWLPSYFEQGLGYSRLEAGSLLVAPAISALVVFIISGTVTDRMLQRGSSSRLVRNVVPCVGVMICAVLLAVLPLIETPVLAVTALSLAYGCGTLAIPLVNASISELCPPQQTAGTMGVFIAIAGIGSLAAPYVTGVLVDNAETAASGYTLAFQCIGILAAISAVLVLVFANPDRDRKLVRRSDESVPA
ncbi:MFS transporter [Streptomyces sp. NPDC102360]|uniref:MFS transporter n=1 Tax=Streptomyces sp. NPDC102360 TaxID=3366160 RepID=UPI0037FE7D23